MKQCINNKLNSFSIKMIMLISCMFFGHTVLAQVTIELPAVGKSMPSFQLADVNYYGKKRLSSDDLKGKWYILDFWTLGCKPCIEAFPKVDKMVKEFKGKVEIIEVGVGADDIKSFYKGIQKKENFNIPMAFDKTLASRLHVNSYPFIFIVDNQGIIRAITSEIESEKLHALINTGENKFAKKTTYRTYKPVATKDLFFVNGNAGSDTSFLFRSVLTKGNPDYQPYGSEMDLNSHKPELYSTQNLKKGRFQRLNTTLLELYNVAYFGEHHINHPANPLYEHVITIPSLKHMKGYSLEFPVLEVKDSSAFFFDPVSYKGLYSYSLSVPREMASRALIMKSMQLDLQKYFGFDANVEERKMPVWELVIVDKALVQSLRTKSGKHEFRYSSKEYLSTKSAGALKGFLGIMASYNPPNLRFLDATDINYEMDLHLKAPFNDLNGTKVELRKVGLDLVKSERMFKVLVIRGDK